MKAAHTLFTSPPRRGKSTFIERMIKAIKRPVAGFFTRDTIEKGIRVGFSIDTLDNRDKLVKLPALKGGGSARRECFAAGRKPVKDLVKSYT